MPMLRPSTLLRTRGLQPFAAKRYASYHSKFAPSYKIQPHFLGFTPTSAVNWAPVGLFMGGAAGIFVLYFAAEIPRFSKDIFEKLPIIGAWYHHEIPPEDNPF